MSPAGRAAVVASLLFGAAVTGLAIVLAPAIALAATAVVASSVLLAKFTRAMTRRGR